MGARSSRNTTQNNRSDGHLLEYFRNTFVRGGGSSVIIPDFIIVSTPSNYVDSGSFRYVLYTSTGPFNVTSVPSTSPGTIDILRVGGGGGGGKWIINARGGGGGGGGGVIYTTAHPITVQNYTATIGAGGAGASPVSPDSFSPGGNTSFTGIPTNALGGGKGGSSGPGTEYYGDGTSPNNGTYGSGGGMSGGYNPDRGYGTSGQGNNGGTASTGPVCSGAGGGGYGGGGGTGNPSSIGGAGGDGGTFPDFPSVLLSPGLGEPTAVRNAWTSAVGTEGWFGAGGGGGGTSSPGAGGQGGTGGGGKGGAHPNAPNLDYGENGVSFTGGGGGGGRGGQPGGQTGGNGANGIIIIKYKAR